MPCKGHSPRARPRSPQQGGGLPAVRSHAANFKLAGSHVATPPRKRQVRPAGVQHAHRCVLVEPPTADASLSRARECSVLAACPGEAIFHFAQN